MADSVAVSKVKSGEKELSGLDLSGADLRWLDLSGANLGKSNLSEANLSGADLRRAILHCQFLREASLSGVIHDETTVWPPCSNVDWFINK